MVCRFQATMLCSVARGAGGGVIGGVLIGAAEAAWCAWRAGHSQDLGLLWWGPLTYGVSFAICGLGLACLVAVAARILGPQRPAPDTFAFCLGGTLAAGVATVARWRFYADFRRGTEDTSLEKGLIWFVTILSAGAIWLAVPLVRALISRHVRIPTGVALSAAAGLAVAAILGTALAPMLLAPQAETRPSQPATMDSAPNVVLIVADALRADFLTLYNPCADSHTPALEALAQDGVVFTRCFAQSSWTKPSFASILTSLYPSTHTATSQFAVLPDRVSTLAELLLANGFYTYGCANNPNVTSFMQFDQGFLQYTDFRPSDFPLGAPSSATQLVLYSRLLRPVYNAVISPEINVRQFYQPADRVTMAALKWLDDEKRQEGDPFHLMLHYMDPHDPYMGGAERGKGFDVRRLGKNPDPDVYRDAMVDAYTGDIAFMDRHLARLFAGLHERGLYDDSVIIFTSDHGEEFFDHKGWGHGMTLYDELIHVPLIIKLPNNVRAGAVNDYMARHIDLAPTVLHLVGIDVPESMRGGSLVDARGAFLNEDVFYSFSETDFGRNAGNALRAVRTKDGKLIHITRDGQGRFDPVEFYDLAVDARETANRAGSGDLREDALRALLDELSVRLQEGAEPAVVQKDLPAALLDRLRSLGYVE